MGEQGRDAQRVQEIRARLQDRWYSAEQTREDVRYLLARLEALAGSREHAATVSSSSDDARIDELTDMIEDLAGNLEDAADTIERAAQAILPGVVVRDVESYRETARKARRLV